ncbi:MAG: TolC family protein [Candidatus Krumholzibacteriia bacterium]
MKLTGLLCLVLTVAVTLPLRGQEVSPVSSAGMTLEQLVAAALHDNAQLRAMRTNWEAMREMPVQERALPNPMFTFSGMDAADNFPGLYEKRYSVEQSFPWPGKRGLRGRIAEKEAEGMRFDYEGMQREIVMMVKETYYELCANRKSVAIIRAEEDVLAQMTEIAETKYAVGEVSQQDVAKAQAEITMVRQKLLETEAQEASWSARLNTLLNRSTDAPLELVFETPPQISDSRLEELQGTAATNRPEVKAMRSQAESRELLKALMRKEYYPDITAGFEYRESFDTGGMAMFMIGIELPIWFNKNAAGVREAEKRVASGRAAVEAAQRTVEFDVRDAWFRLRTAWQTLDLYRKDLLPQAQLRFSASEAGYRVSKVDFMDLLESERFLLNARIMHVMAEADVGMQHARLERAIGAGVGDQTVDERSK